MILFNCTPQIGTRNACRLATIVVEIGHDVDNAGQGGMMAHHGIIALTVEVVVASDELAIRSAAATASEGYFNGGIGGELK